MPLKVKSLPLPPTAKKEGPGTFWAAVWYDCPCNDVSAVHFDCKPTAEKLQDLTNEGETLIAVLEVSEL